MNEQSTYRTAGRLLAVLFLINAVLVSTHRGEFWPFSVFPMFSQGGHLWTRSLVREVPDVPDSLSWEATTLHHLPGRPFPLDTQGISQNDVAGLLFNTKTRSEQREKVLRRLFAGEADPETLLFMRAQPLRHENDSLTVTVQPLVLLTPDSAYLNPHLETERSPGR